MNNRLKWICYGLAGLLILVLTVLWLQSDQISKVEYGRGSELGGEGVPLENELANAVAVSTDDSPQKSLAKPSEKIISGTVSLASTGAPVANAKVLVYDEGNNPGQALPSAFTDEAGEYEISGLFQGRILLLARKGHLLSYARRNQLIWRDVSEEGDAVAPINLGLLPAVALRLKVVSQGEHWPLANAIAQTRMTPKVVYSANDDGEIVIPLSRDVWSLNVSSPGYSLKSERFDLAMGFENTFEVELARAGQIYGLVLNAGGDPLPGVTVFASLDEVDFEVVSDATGAYELDHIPPNMSVSIRCHEKGVGSYSMVHRLDSLIAEEYNIVLTKSNVAERVKPDPVRVEGHVVDMNNQPISDAVIAYFLSYGQTERVEVRSDSEGQFQTVVSPALPTPEFLCVSKPGYGSQAVSFSRDATVTTKVKVVLKPGRFLKGRVLSARGRPLSGAKIQPLTWGAIWLSLKLPPVISAESGYFELTDLPENAHIRISAEGYPSLPAEPELDRSGVDFTLLGMGDIRGRVVKEATGELVASYKLFLKRQDGVRMGKESAQALYGEGVRVQSADGAFLLRDLVVGNSFTISASTEDYSLEEPQVVEIVPPGEERPLLLKLTPNQDRYAGVVLDSKEQGLSGVVLSLYGRATSENAGMATSDSFDWDNVIRDATYRASEVTDAAGGFAFEAVPHKSLILITAERKDFVPSQLENLNARSDTEKQSLEFRLLRGSTLEVVIKLEPLPQFPYLYISDNNGFSDLSTPDDPQKVVRFTGLLPGEYQIELRDFKQPAFEQFPFAKATIRLAEGVNEVIELGGEDRYRLAGIALVGGELAAGRILGLYPVGNQSPEILSPQIKTTNDDDGHFSFEGLEPGAYFLALKSRQPTDRTWDQPRPQNVISVEISSEDVFDHFEFKKMNTVSGVLAKSSGVNALLLAAHPQLRQTSNLQTALSINGKFSFLDVSPGVYSLHAIDAGVEGSRLVLRDVIVPEGGVDVDLGEVNGERTGQLRLKFETALSLPSDPSFFFFIHEITETLNPENVSQYPSYMYSDLSKPYEIEGLGEGIYRLCGGILKDGWMSFPVYPTFEIRVGETTDLVLDMLAVTELEVSLPQDLDLTHATMFHLETQQEIRFELKLQMPIVGQLQTQFATGYEGNLFARGFREGQWRLRVVGKAGKTIEREFEAVRGHKVSLTLTP